MKMQHLNFIERLINQNQALKRLKPHNIMIFNVSGNLGYYQVKVGPLNADTNTRQIEINGQIYHLFISKNHIETIPTSEEVKNNLRGLVIMKDIMIHLIDEDGAGFKVKIERHNLDGVHPRNLINLGGDNGREMLQKLEESGRMAEETYHLIQEDILKSS
jgi:hypothetical protein